MGRTYTNKNKAININESSRQTQKDFSEQIPADTVGPSTSNRTAAVGEDVANTSQTSTQINKWKVMTTGDDGLKTALYEWINTTRDGIKVAPQVTTGRQKKLTFNFYGNIGKSIAPGEIGEFNLIFIYPPVHTHPTGISTE